MLEIRQLSYAYDARSAPVLRGVDLALRPGTVHGLVGANGAGKTTLLYCLYGLLNGYAGTVRDTTGQPLRPRTGLLPYEPYFYPRLTGREYVAYCLHARGQPVPAALDQWNELLELPLDCYAETYSAGMKKKLALLALLVQNLPYLVLDEPFNGLDLESNLLLTELLRRLRQRGTGLLLTSHLLGPLLELADEVTVLVAGQVHRHYQPAEFGRVEPDLLRELHAQKLQRLDGLL